MKIGYAWVSSVDQNLDRQIAALRAEGCNKIFREMDMKHRPELAKAIDALPTKGVPSVHRLWAAASIDRPDMRPGAPRSAGRSSTSARRA